MFNSSNAVTYPDPPKLNGVSVLKAVVFWNARLSLNHCLKPVDDISWSLLFTKKTLPCSASTKLYPALLISTEDKCCVPAYPFSDVINSVGANWNMSPVPNVACAVFVAITSLVVVLNIECSWCIINSLPTPSKLT